MGQFGWWGRWGLRGHDFRRASGEHHQHPARPGQRKAMFCKPLELVAEATKGRASSASAVQRGSESFSFPTSAAGAADPDPWTSSAPCFPFRGL